MTRLREAECFHIAQRNQLEQQLEVLNQQVVSLKAENSSREVDCEQLRTLRIELDASQAKSSQKEKELISIQEDLNITNKERSALELGKTKAKGEIYTLLLRLQESEGWMKNVKEKMETLGVSVPTESYEETWNKLKMLLHWTVLNRLPNSTHKDAPDDTVVTPNSRKTAAGPFQDFALAESTHRTQKASKDMDYILDAHKNLRSELPNSTVDYVPDSQKSTCIVPFSSFQGQLSPTKCSSNEDTEDLENIFAELRTPPSHFTPVERPKSSQKLSGKRKRSISSNSTTEKKAFRSTQRTYSKARQLSVSQRHKRDAGIENVDHIQSPMSIASGSGRKNSAREETKRRWAARGQRRPGRKTRGKEQGLSHAKPQLILFRRTIQHQIQPGRQ